MLVSARNNTTLEITLRPGTESDNALLLTIFCEARGGMFAALPEAQKDKLLRMQFDAQRSSYSDSYPDAERVVVLVSGEPAGALLVERSGNIWRLVDIAVLARYRNQGVGTRVIGDLVALAAASGKSFRLQVASENPAARLYERLGMRVVESDDVYLTMESVARDEKMGAADFAALVNTQFVLPDGTDLLLEKVSEVTPLGSLERFTLSFRREGAHLAQGSYLLKHPGFGEMEIFIVPVALGMYEALFSMERREEA